MLKSPKSVAEKAKELSSMRTVLEREHRLLNEKVITDQQNVKDTSDLSNMSKDQKKKTVFCLFDSFSGSWWKDSEYAFTMVLADLDVMWESSSRVLPRLKKVNKSRVDFGALIQLLGFTIVVWDTREVGLASGRACLRVCVSTRRGDNLVTSFSFLVSLFAGVFEGSHNLLCIAVNV
ncbi:hypothetical protein Tco_0440117 [Tanacetum coccineum]